MLSKKIKWMTALAILSTPLLAQAGDLSITNNTDLPSTSIINGGLCSNILPGGAGITQPHSTNVVPQAIMNAACWVNRDNCTADIYLTDNCTGDKEGRVVISTTSGIKSITVDGKYSLKGSGFNITLG
jgi:hypothetical protein